VDVLRYADAPPVEVEVLIDAPAGVVWALVTDIQLPARFSPEFLGAEWLDGATGPAMGARFRGRNRHRAFGTWETVATVAEYEQFKVFGYIIGEPAEPSAHWRFSLSADGDRTSLRQWARMGPGWSGLSVAIDRMPDKEHKIVAGRLEEFRANMTSTVTGIKEFAEATP
jgi:uncharacterized protein YndB with AHSA1/START domain